MYLLLAEVTIAHAREMWAELRDTEAWLVCRESYNIARRQGEKGLVQTNGFVACRTEENVGKQ